MTLLILAAGLGSRYGGNKQFDGVGPNQEYLLEFTVYDAIQAGIEQVVIVTRKEAVEDVEAYFKPRLPKSVKLKVAVQSLEDVPNGFEVPNNRKKPWGTAHAVWSARDVINGKFATVNADDLYGRKGIEAATRFMSTNPEKGKHGLVGYRLRDTLSEFGTVSRGICREQNGYLSSVTEHTKLRESGEEIRDDATNEVFTGNELTSMNLWIADDSIFSVIEAHFLKYFEDKRNLDSGELYLPIIMQQLIDSNQTSVKLIDGDSEWYGMTYREDKEQLREVLENLTVTNHYPSPLWLKS